MTEDLPSYEDVLRIQAANAAEGSVTAMRALERVLRNMAERDKDPIDAELRRLLE